MAASSMLGTCSVNGRLSRFRKYKVFARRCFVHQSRSLLGANCSRILLGIRPLGLGQFSVWMVVLLAWSYGLILRVNNMSKYFLLARRVGDVAR